jgi:hypothetical protein
VICDNALIGGFAADRRPVDRDLVLEVCRDLDLLRSDGGTPRHNGNGHRSAPVPASEPRAPEISFVHARPPEGRHGGVTEVAAADNPSGMFAALKRRRPFSFF